MKILNLSKDVKPCETCNTPEIKCDVCGCHPSLVIRTEFGTFCQQHTKYVKDVVTFQQY